MLGSRLQNAADAAALASSPILSDSDATFLGVGHGWNDYQAMAIDGSLRGVDVPTVHPTYMYGTEQRIPAGSPTRWTIEVLVRLATPTDDSTDRVVWASTGTELQHALSWRFGAFRAIYGGGIGSNTVVPPGLGVAPQTYYVVYSVEPDPGVGGNIINRLMIWNVATGSFSEVSRSITVSATPDAFHYGAFNTAGALPFAGDAGAQAGTRFYRISSATRTRSELSRTLPLVSSWPVPTPLPSLQTGLLFFPSMETLVDPISTEEGVATGTVYDAAANARDFDGVDDAIAWSSVLDLTSLPFTCAVWIRADVIGSSDIFFDVDAASTSDAYQFRFNNTAGRIEFLQVYSPGTHRRRASVEIVNPSQWTQIVVSADGTSLASGVRLYIDGIETTYSLSTNGSGTPRVPDGEWLLGNTSLGTQALDGLLPEAKVWDRVLSGAEIYNLWQSSPHLL